MLVLSRETDEAVTLTMPDGIKIEIINLGYRKGRMKMGVIAPRDVDVKRNELLEGSINSFSRHIKRDS